MRRRIASAVLFGAEEVIRFDLDGYDWFFASTEG